MTINERFKEVYEWCEKHGWKVDKSRMHHNGPSFHKGDTHIWKIRGGWQVADLIDDRYQNHRPVGGIMYALYREEGLEIPEEHRGEQKPTDFTYTG